jgi:hypothetical protein
MIGMNERRDKLGSSQIHILRVLYKFRFGTTRLLSEYRKVRVSATYKSLAALVQQEYVVKRYDSGYRLQGRGAEYFLGPKAIPYLKDNPDLDPNVLRSVYKNSSVKPEFVSHVLTVFGAALSVRESYPQSFHIFSKNELKQFDSLPYPRPDIYLSRIKPSPLSVNQYILDMQSDSRFFIIKKRFISLLEHYESGQWEATEKTDYPTILLTCLNSSVEASLRRFVTRTLDSAGVDELRVYTTTQAALRNSPTTTTAIWRNTLNPSSLVSL